MRHPAEPRPRESEKAPVLERGGGEREREKGGLGKKRLQEEYNFLFIKLRSAVHRPLKMTKTENDSSKSGESRGPGQRDKRDRPNRRKKRREKEEKIENGGLSTRREAGAAAAAGAEPRAGASKTI